MQESIGVLKAMLNYGTFLKYGTILRKIPNLEKEMKSIIAAITKFYEKYGEDRISIDSLQTFYNYLNPQQQNPDMLELTFSSMRNLDVSDALLGDLLNQIVERHIVTEIVTTGTDLINATIPTCIDDLRAKIDEYDQITGLVDDVDADICDLDIDELFTEENLDGLPFRMRWMKDTFGPLKSGTLGHIFARPDAGKTSMALFLLTLFAKYLSEERPGLYLNNEEGIDRIKQRAMCSLIDRPEAWIYDNRQEAKKLWHVGMCYDNLKFIGSCSDIYRVEKHIKKFNPRVVIIDQGPKVNTPGKEEGVARLQKLYNLYRTMATDHDCSIITLGQADTNASNRKFLTLNNLDSSKVAIPGELDWAIGIGRVEESGYENVRYLNVCKNKLSGRYGSTEVSFNSDNCTFKEG
ncbi:MAG: AAA family ATPase [Planctomycetota bacterium]|jgi:hypothetical protein